MAGDAVCSVALGVIADLRVAGQQDWYRPLWPNCCVCTAIASIAMRKPIHRFGSDVVAIAGLLTI
jgi:hypothetical protein